MEKEAQIQLSFGMIFSVIIIIITLAVAGYVIMSFVKNADCAKLGSFEKSMEDQVDRVYQSISDTQRTLTNLPLLPSKITAVCFGNLDQDALGSDKEKRGYFIDNKFKKDRNLYFYPMPESCDRKYASFTIEHITTNEFFCLQVKSGKVTPKITKDDSTNLLVRLNK